MIKIMIKQMIQIRLVFRMLRIDGVRRAGDAMDGCQGNHGSGMWSGA